MDKLKNKKIAALFPGQGSQALGMGMDFAENFAVSKEVFDKLATILPALPDIIQNSLEELTLTQNQQPALVAASIAAFLAWQQTTGLTPSFAAGHSLGEYSALVAAEALDIEDAFRLTSKRGEFMQNAVPVGQGAMSAVIGDPDFVIDVCQNIACEAANFNAPNQTVISGLAGAVKEVGEILKQQKLRVIPLKVSAPFHSQYMQPAADNMQELLQNTDFASPKFPVFANKTAMPYGDPKKLLLEQITAPVLWVDTIKNMQEAGAEVFIEFGAGKVLTGLTKKILPEAEVYNISQLKDLDIYD